MAIKEHYRLWSRCFEEKKIFFARLDILAQQRESSRFYGLEFMQSAETMPK
jgi:hypothetical protein